MVIALGATLRLEFGPNRFFSIAAAFCGAGEALADTLPSVAMVLAVSAADTGFEFPFPSTSCSWSSTPKDSFPFATFFRFFFGGGP